MSTKITKDLHSRLEIIASGYDERSAKVVFKKLGIPFPRKWSDRREILHMWHAGRISYFVTYREFCYRVCVIVRAKPAREILIRLRSIKPVWWKWERTPGRRIFEKRKLFDDSSYFDWVKSDKESIMKLHDKHCKRCTWSWRSKKMTFRR